MNCETCGEPMRRLSDWMESTCVGYDSPAGHDHDDNCVTRAYSCKNGHSVAVSLRRRCPACDWIGKAECWCHAGKKLDAWPA